MARLLGAESAWVRANRLEAVRKAAAASGCVVLLKGADTLVAEPGGRVAVSHAGPPGLATAGSGDVLTGAVAAMLAKGGDPGTAACIAAEAHGLAGRLAIERRGPVRDHRHRRDRRACRRRFGDRHGAGAGDRDRRPGSRLVERAPACADAAAPAEVWAVVKADGYGHGAAAVGRAALAAGAAGLCVATWDEARALRDDLGDVPVLVMGPLVPGQESDVEGVDVTVTSVEGFSRLRAAARAPLGVHVKADTGMGRWGMGEDDALRLAEQLADGDVLALGGLMSHLAVADSDETFTRGQVERFAALAERFPACPRHIANSAGGAARSARLGSTRCAAGSRVYGLSPFGDGPGRRRARAGASARELRRRGEAPRGRARAPGTAAGSWRRSRRGSASSRPATPTAFRASSPAGPTCSVRGRRRRVAATVSMDQLTFVIGAGVRRRRRATP